jgi:hypothetical protein
MSTSAQITELKMKELMNIQDNFQSLIEIARNMYDFEFEQKLYKLRIYYIRKAMLIFILQRIENEINIINRGLIILNQNKNNHIITSIININLQVKLLEEKQSIIIKCKALDDKLIIHKTNLSNYLTPDILYKLRDIKKNLLDMINSITSI